MGRTTETFRALNSTMMNEETPLTGTERNRSLVAPIATWWIAFFSALMGVLVGALMVDHHYKTINDTFTIPILGHAHDHHHHQKHEKGSTMTRTPANPFDWGDDFSMNLAEVTSGASRTLRISGQSAVQADGETVAAPDDFRGQLVATLANLDAVLQEGKMTKSDLIKVVIYTADFPGLLENYDVYMDWLAGNKPPLTAVGVTTLFIPELKIEIDIEAAN